MSSSESQRLRPERLIGDSAMEIGKTRIYVGTMIQKTTKKSHVSYLHTSWNIHCVTVVCNCTKPVSLSSDAAIMTD